MADMVKIATRESYGNALAELGREHSDVIVFDADLSGATKTSVFKKAFPDRHFNCGIAEGPPGAPLSRYATPSAIPI